MSYIIFFFKIRMIFSLVAMTGLEKMLHNICISAMAMSLRWATRGPGASCFDKVSPEWWLLLISKFVISFKILLAAQYAVLHLSVNSSTTLVTIDVQTSHLGSLLFYWSGAQKIVPLWREDAILETSRLVSCKFDCDFWSKEPDILRREFRRKLPIGSFD